ncbi:hypothetical protein L0U85_14685 [Glycomyces sp. L485]|uniref:hypothetical protein n=1 Tax=Glycomyces sp. L485 TaxID=2909235 RepID=UPI001F4AD427|nr:hypothetical protein [Glycomyces sp. L485]MCH7232091.1 hypothetical protein [Glycomyces sp. L485]
MAHDVVPDDAPRVLVGHGAQPGVPVRGDGRFRPGPARLRIEVAAALIWPVIFTLVFLPLAVRRFRNLGR